VNHSCKLGTGFELGFWKKPKYVDRICIAIVITSGFFSVELLF